MVENKFQSPFVKLQDPFVHDARATQQSSAYANEDNLMTVKPNKKAPNLKIQRVIGHGAFGKLPNFSLTTAV